MLPLIIDCWQSLNSDADAHIVMPDGCRDVIYRERSGYSPEWFISPLFDTATLIKSSGMTTMFGFRLKAGVKIDEPRLLDVLRNLSPDKDEVANHLANEVDQYKLADEALKVLALCPPNIAQAAKTLGVSMRTLQRHVLALTDRTPAYWLSLSRARKCARSIDPSQSLSDTASQYGYADQSHMNRDFRRWFDATPGEFQRKPELKTLVDMSGYGDA